MERGGSPPVPAIPRSAYIRTPMLFSPSERPEAESRSAGLARTLRKAIMDGRLKPGQPLREGELARELGTSRTPIREALLLMQADGLIEAVPNRGAVVRSYDAEDLADLYEMRALLEGYAARKAATLITDEGIAELERSCERYRALRNSEQLTELTDENFTFHEVILRTAGSGRLTSMVHQLTAVPLVYRSYLAYSDENRQTAEGHHRAITAALKARDSDRAGALMEGHVRWAGERAIAHQSVLS